MLGVKKKHKHIFTLSRVIIQALCRGFLFSHMVVLLSVWVGIQGDITGNKTRRKRASLFQNQCTCLQMDVSWFSCGKCTVFLWCSLSQSGPAIGPKLMNIHTTDKECSGKQKWSQLVSKTRDGERGEDRFTHAGWLRVVHILLHTGRWAVVKSAMANWF